MGADFSRVRLNPLLDYAGVELKQGAALLDADANELVAILDRRLRALAGDTLGRATVSSTTPDGFKIAVAVGAMQIGKAGSMSTGCSPKITAHNPPTRPSRCLTACSARAGSPTRSTMRPSPTCPPLPPADRRSPPGLSRRLGP